MIVPTLLGSPTHTLGDIAAQRRFVLGIFSSMIAGVIVAFAAHRYYRKHP
jgi:hypothetical protein